jgi:NAD(P)-dependent dehydrogenase (short-subunit alcohol dehydrogenase family)
MRLWNKNNPVAAALTGIADRWRVPRELPALSPDERLDGQTALVTGAASGLGFAASVGLARRGARVLMLDRRDLPAAIRRARDMTGGCFEPHEVDLSDLSAVERLMDTLASAGERLSLVILNASIVPTQARTTAQGLDEMFVVNYLSSFALVDRLLGRGLLAQGLPDPPRIIFVSSEAHRWSRDLDTEHLERPRDPSVCRVLDSYGYFKLMLTTFAWELARRLGPRACVFALCPGAMNTNIVREAPRLLRAPLKAAMRLFFQDPFTAAGPLLYLACSRSLRDRTAVYLHKKAVKEPDARARDAAVGARLFERSGALLEMRGNRSSW